MNTPETDPDAVVGRPDLDALMLVSTACFHMIRHVETGTGEAARQAAGQLECVARLPGIDLDTARLASRLAARCQRLATDDRGQPKKSAIGV